MSFSRSLPVVLLILFSVFGFSQTKFKKIDSLQAVVLKAPEDTNKVLLLNKLCASISRLNGVDSASYFKYFRESIDLSKKSGYYRGEIEARIAAGGYCTTIGKYSYGRNILNSGLAKAEQMRDSSNILATLTRIGTLYWQEGYYSIAAEYQYKALVYAEALKDKSRLSSVYNVLGNIYIDQKDCRKAVLYHIKALDIRTGLKDSLRISHSYVNLGISYCICHRYDSATFYYSNALAIQTKKRNKIGQAYSYDGLGNCYLLKGDYQSAIPYFKRAYVVLKESDDINERITNLNFLGKSNLKLGNPDEALPYYEEAKTMAESSNKLIELKESYVGLSELYELKNDFKEAHKYHKLYTAINDTINNKETIRKVSSLEYNRQIEQEEKIRTLETEKTRIAHEAEVKKQRMIIWLVSIVVVMVLILSLFIYREYKAKKSANEIITLQKQEVENQKQIIEEKQKEILDSINYAKQIQNALLAHHDFVDEHLPENFILFKPKDIVSGDFYWATEVKSYSLDVQASEPITNNPQLFYLACCDSTGHGVPGAFMSLLNIGFMSEAINEKGIISPELVFNYVRGRLISSISRDNQKDGFDGILMRFEFGQDKIIVEYAAANNAPLLISDGKLIELEKDKMPVGKGEKTESFKLHKVNLKKGDMLYLYTDGYADQFGGSKGKKFKYKPLNDLLLEIHLLSLKEQSLILNQRFEEWKGELEQVDDVCVIGIRV
ncbi:MAG: protein serine/threonine phosphatase [Bacteroidetes bacterium]|jgi:serine phosphatase RsbU (regulator of sigma subunit)|nr:protein serine/threonine phosphatase [Bacteroidota bacterium]